MKRTTSNRSLAEMEKSSSVNNILDTIASFYVRLERGQTVPTWANDFLQRMHSQQTRCLETYVAYRAIAMGRFVILKESLVDTYAKSKTSVLERYQDCKTTGSVQFQKIMGVVSLEQLQVLRAAGLQDLRSLATELRANPKATSVRILSQAVDVLDNSVKALGPFVGETRVAVASPYIQSLGARLQAQ